VLDELVEDAVDMMDHLGRVPAGQKVRAARPKDGELIEGPERVMFILQAPGHWEEDLHVTISDGVLKVKAPNFAARRLLPADVDTSSFEKSYTNGVLSVNLKRRQ
jgi:HSP20 family molecular chaperone IbpA